MSRIARDIGRHNCTDCPTELIFERLLGEKIDSIISNTDKHCLSVISKTVGFTQRMVVAVRHFPNMKTDLIYG